jgi:hypothetical protein
VSELMRSSDSSLSGTIHCVSDDEDGMNGLGCRCRLGCRNAPGTGGSEDGSEGDATSVPAPASPRRAARGELARNAARASRCASYARPSSTSSFRCSSASRWRPVSSFSSLVPRDVSTGLDGRSGAPGGFAWPWGISFLQSGGGGGGVVTSPEPLLVHDPPCSRVGSACPETGWLGAGLVFLAVGGCSL